MCILIQVAITDYLNNSIGERFIWHIVTMLWLELKQQGLGSVLLLRSVSIILQVYTWEEMWILVLDKSAYLEIPTIVVDNSANRIQGSIHQPDNTLVYLPYLVPSLNSTSVPPKSTSPTW